MTSNTEYHTLRIVHLPPHLTDEKRDELLKKYGAVHTKTIRKSEKYSTTFAEFSSRETAMRAFMQLQSLEIKGRHISIEFANKSINDQYVNEAERLLASDKDEQKESGDFHAFINKLTNWSTNYAFSQPPPPSISYKYPQPTRNTLLRIAIQMIKEPAFYTQVLHLMNKMNLPPPFEELDEEFPALRDVYDIENYEDVFGKVLIDSEEIIEDELESEIESDNDESRPEVIPIKRHLPQLKKRLKIPKFVNPMKQPASTVSNKNSVKTEDMFESVKIGEMKNLRIDLKSVEKLGNSEAKNAGNHHNSEEKEGGFGLIFPPITEEHKNKGGENKPEEKKDFITSEELAENRINLNDQRLLPVFQNYYPGKPSCRLYIKNLSKHVELNDLHYIYKRYVLSSLDNSESQYDIRLMQEGRMKGQAFVTFQNMGQAQLALNETNGYILKDKPMVVQFAKNTKS